MNNTGLNLNRRSSSRANNLQRVYHQRRARKKKIDLFLYLFTGIKAFSGFLITVCLSVAAVFSYSLLTQCDYFRVEKIEVKGMRSLSRTEVLNQAGLADGVNILSVNLSAAQKRLAAHSDIFSAEIQRSFPGGLAILIEEQSPLAAVDFGEKYLMNSHGGIYKKWKTDTPLDIPLVTGLDVTDFENLEDKNNPCRAILHLLQSRRGFLEKNGMYPLKTIRVDGQMGLTLNFDKTRVLKLGCGDYDEKLMKLDKVLNFMKNEYELVGFSSMDLTNLSRVVLKPIKSEGSIQPDEEV